MPRQENGVDGVETGFGQQRHQRIDAAAAMEHDFQPVAVAEDAEFFEPGQQETAKEVRADQRPGLAAEIVADKEDVKPVGRGFKNAAVHLEVETGDPVQDRVDETGVFVHFQTERFQAQQVDEVVPERGPGAAQDGERFPVGRRLGMKPGSVQPVRVRPGVTCEVGPGGLRERVAERLSVTDAPAFHAEEAPGVGGRGEGNRRGRIGFEDPAEIVPETLADSFVIEVQTPAGLFPEPGRGAAPGRNPVRFPVFESGHYPLARSELLFQVRPPFLLSRESSRLIYNTGGKNPSRKGRTNLRRRLPLWY